jgi:16S rRNA (guanine1516-N2)-methyltransferase
LELKVTSSFERQKCALELASDLGLDYLSEVNEGLVLQVGQRLELREANSKTGPVYVDFEALVKRPKYKKDLLAKAVGIKGSYRPIVIDATAGLGQDAFMLASYGCEVTMIERSKIIAALLQDGLARTKQLEAVSRLTLFLGDAKDLLPNLTRPDVIYLDPMYPESGKTALKRKEMRLFRELVGDDVDVLEVLELALQAAIKRVVLKRPLKAPTLGKPNLHYQGSTIRFDVYTMLGK